MSRIVRCSLIQASNAASPDASMEAIKRAMMAESFSGNPGAEGI
jgi:hypothetical protein